MHPPKRIAEDELIEQCKSGSLKYQELLYKQFYGYAMGIGLRYSLNRDDAMEVVNDAFIKVFNAIKHFDSDKPFKAWLRTILVNTAIDRRRKDLMKELPPVQITIFNLYEVDGYSHDEIGQMLSIPVSSSRVYLSRAKEKLRSVLRSEEQKHG